MQGNIFIITGPSGVGKGTICNLLLQQSPALTLSVSATSRPIRAGEQDGINYHFKTRAAFEAMIQHDRQETDPQRHHLLEWAEYNGNYYGTLRATVQDIINAARNVLLEIETQGALQVKQKFPAACQIFIAPPSMEALQERLRGRGTEDEANMASRLQIAERELEQGKTFDYVVINADLGTCVAEIQSIIAGIYVA